MCRLEAARRTVTASFLFGLFLVVTAALPSTARAQKGGSTDSIPSDLLVTKVVFSGASHVPCKDNTGVDLPPEQYLATTYNDGELDWFDKLIHHHPTAVKMGGTVNVSFTLHRPASQVTWSGTLSLNPTYDGAALPGGGAQSISVPSGGDASVTFSVGPFPNMVKPKKTLVCTLVPSPNNVSIWGADSTPVTEPVYLVYSTPNAPQVKPWLGVLDNACAWAEGQSTYSDVAKMLTKGEFFSLRFY